MSRQCNLCCDRHCQIHVYVFTIVCPFYGNCPLCNDLLTVHIAKRFVEIRADGNRIRSSMVDSNTGKDFVEGGVRTSPHTVASASAPVMAFRKGSPGLLLDIAKGKLFQQFHLDHRPSGTQRYHTFCLKSRNISVNSLGAALSTPTSKNGMDLSPWYHYGYPL